MPATEPVEYTLAALVLMTSRPTPRTYSLAGLVYVRVRVLSPSSVTLETVAVMTASPVRAERRPPTAHSPPDSRQLPYCIPVAMRPAASPSPYLLVRPRRAMSSPRPADTTSAATP